MTVSNIISPLMVSMDRFFIGAFVSVGAIAYYATPFDMVTKTFAISNAFVSVLFPMFGALYLADPRKVIRLYFKGLKMILILLTPILLLIGVGAKILLLHWLGSSFAQYGGPVMRILCLGVLINAMAAVPFAFLQGVARPDLTAKFHLAEAPLYIMTLWILGTRFGILGVAWAWTIRVSFDFILLVIATNRIQTKLVNVGLPQGITVEKSK
jgi:O-antigen/teichoic acid export membrane protein